MIHNIIHNYKLEKLAYNTWKVIAPCFLDMNVDTHA